MCPLLTQTTQPSSVTSLPVLEASLAALEDTIALEHHLACELSTEIRRRSICGCFVKDGAVVLMRNHLENGRIVPDAAQGIWNIQHYDKKWQSIPFHEDLEVVFGIVQENIKRLEIGYS